jgi:hypothetical protein
MSGTGGIALPTRVFISRTGVVDFLTDVFVSPTRVDVFPTGDGIGRLLALNRELHAKIGMRHDYRQRV